MRWTPLTASQGARLSGRVIVQRGVTLNPMLRLRRAAFFEPATQLLCVDQVLHLIAQFLAVAI
jgi:hypothetical protein